MGWASFASSELGGQDAHPTILDNLFFGIPNDCDRNPCANIMFVLECMWRSQAVSFDDLKVMNWDRGSVFIGYHGCDHPPAVVIY